VGIALVPYTKEGVVINVVVSGIDPAELADDVLFVPA
jgi:hypothetical protein